MALDSSGKKMKCIMHSNAFGGSCSDACRIRTFLDKSFIVGHIAHGRTQSDVVEFYEFFDNKWFTDKKVKNHLAILPKEDLPEDFM